MSEPSGGLGIANTVTGHIVSAIARRLEAGDRERIRRYFALALEWAPLDEHERSARERSGGGKVASKAKRIPKWIARRIPRPWNSGKEEGRKAEALARDTAGQAVERCAIELEDEWNKVTLKTLTGGDAMNGAGDGYWLASLQACIEQTATERLDPGDARHLHWRWILPALREKESEADLIQRWARLVCGQVVVLWDADPHLRRLIARLDFETGLGLQQAMLRSSRQNAAEQLSRRQDVAEQLRTALPSKALTLAGGGGVALLVLFIDKG
jgi:hypothetical protein